MVTTGRFLCAADSFAALASFPERGIAMKFEKKTVLVTGANRGIGLALCRLLKERVEGGRRRRGGGASSVAKRRADPAYRSGLPRACQARNDRFQGPESISGLHPRPALPFPPDQPSQG